MSRAINPMRGDVALALGDRRYRLRLTFGALAEIETGLGVSSLTDLAVRLRALSVADMTTVLCALLRGGGEDEAAAQVHALPAKAGVAASAIAAAFREAFA